MYDRRGHAFIERAAKSLVAQVRVGRSAIEVRIGADMQSPHGWWSIRVPCLIGSKCPMVSWSNTVMLGAEFGEALGAGVGKLVLGGVDQWAGIWRSPRDGVAV